MQFLHFNTSNMNTKKDFKIYADITKDNTSLFKEVSEYTKLFLKEIDILEISGMSKKQLDLYLFRHPEIIKTKNWKQRIISINILPHVLKNIHRMKKVD